MNLEQLIANAYQVFSEIEKPQHSTNYSHCEECAEYDEMLSTVEKRDLSIEQIGTVCWGPVPFLTPEATAYYIPRLIELAAEGVENKDLEPYFNQFINTVCEGPSGRQYSLFGDVHRRAVASVLIYIKSNYYDLVCEHCWGEELDKACANWPVQNQ